MLLKTKWCLLKVDYEAVIRSDMERLEIVVNEVVSKLNELRLQVATAESCTGGLLSATIVDVSGASAIFHEGYVTYSNEAKEKNLGISHDTLVKYGAVSSQTAAEMAKGAALRANAQMGISTTGIAGPTGGTQEKPVGLVFIGCYFEGQVVTKEFHFTGNRQTVREQAVLAALNLVREVLER